MLIPLSLAGIGIGIFYHIKKYGSTPDLTKVAKNKKTFGLVWAIIAVPGALMIVLAMFAGYFKTRSIYSHKQYTTVEGKVEHYHPMPATGHDVESFDVNGVHFEYSDFVVTMGYNNAASRGGAIRKDMYVRIGYYKKDKYNNVILKLETE